MQYRHICLLFTLSGLLITGCEKLTTEPDSQTNSNKIDGMTFWGGEYDDFGYGVYETADGGYAVVGSQYSLNVQNNLVLVKFNSSLDVETNGEYKFSTINDSTNNSANDVQQTEDGGYITVGNTFNGTDYDVLVVKLKPDLSEEWQDTIKGSYNDFGNSIQQTTDGGYIVCGTQYDGNDEDVMLWKITVTAGTPAYTTLYDAESSTDNGTRDHGVYAQQTRDNGYIIAATSATGIQITKLSSDGTADTEFNTDGSPLTVGSAGDEATYIQQISDGSYIVLGNTEGGTGSQSEVYINTISSAGVSVLTRTMGEAYDDKANMIIETDDGGFVFTGSQYNEITGHDIWIVKLNPNLSTEWSVNYDGQGYNDSGASIMLTDDGGYIIAGSSHVIGNQSQIILLKIEANGCIYSLDHKTQITCGI